MTCYDRLKSFDPLGKAGCCRTERGEQVRVAGHEHVTACHDPVVASLLRESNKDVVHAGIRQ